MDLDGDGVISLYELEYFYEDQVAKMEALGIEAMPFGDCACSVLDLIKPKENGKITLGDLKRCQLAHIFFNTFLNLDKYVEYEQRDPFATSKVCNSFLSVSSARSATFFMIACRCPVVPLVKCLWALLKQSYYLGGGGFGTVEKMAEILNILYVHLN